MAVEKDALSRIKRDQYADKAGKDTVQYQGFTTRSLDEQVRDLREVVLGQLGDAGAEEKKEEKNNDA